MRPPLLHRALLLLCLAAFGLGPALIAPRAVRCTGPGGITRVEFACVKSKAGCCASTPHSDSPDADETDADHEHGPCHDVPAGPLVHTAKLAYSAPSLDDALPQAFEITPPSTAHAAVLGPGLPAPRTAQAERPPDPLTALSTVRLTV